MRVNKASKKCYICGKPYTSLCDATNENGEPCDIPMCDEHRNRVTIDVDVCNHHNNPKDREQAKKNRLERERARLYFRSRYGEVETRMLSDILFEPATMKEVDEWIEKRKREDKAIKERIKEKKINDIIAKTESKKAINKSIKVLENLIEHIKTQHMLKDIDGDTTSEDTEIYRDRFVALRLGLNGLKKQIELIEWIEELERENEYDMKMIKEFKDILKEVTIV